MGAAWASGINLYATILTLGWLGSSGALDLPQELEIVQHPAVLTCAAILFVVEFFADKVPGLDSLWDSIQTFVRIPAGAVLAASAVGDVDPAISLAAALIGGSVAAATHAAKAGSRLMINTSPEPVTNWTASIFEDIAVILGLWTAINYPWLFLLLFICFIGFLIWLLPRLWRLIKNMGRKIIGFFRGTSAKSDSKADSQPLPTPVQELSSNKEPET